MLYKPFIYPQGFVDPFIDPGNDVIVGDPNFHAQNVYTIIMRTLARFEYALGRRVGWSFPGHQLKVAPHAFADANAFYSARDEALMFGYFPGRQGTIFTCLSHDVVAHETTHELVDGLRSRYTDPASPDQAAFHEGFADVVALLSVFSLRDVVDEFGWLKFAIGNRLINSERQTRWLQHLWDYGYFERGASLRRRFSAMHRLRSLGLHRDPPEVW